MNKQYGHTHAATLSVIKIKLIGDALKRHCPTNTVATHAVLHTTELDNQNDPCLIPSAKIFSVNKFKRSMQVIQSQEVMQFSSDASRNTTRLP